MGINKLITLLKIQLWIGFSVSLLIADYSAWQHQSKIYIRTGSDGINLQQDVSQVPLVIRLNDEIFNFSEAKPNGEDIRFANQDGSVALGYEVERWDPASGKAEIWVLVPQVQANNDDQFIWMYWGNSTAQDSSVGQNVFTQENNYWSVWHLSESIPGEGTAGLYKDSGPLQMDGDDFAETETPLREMVGPSQRFNASTKDYIHIPNSIDKYRFGQGNYTIQLWAYALDSIQNYRAYMLSKYHIHDKIGFNLRRSGGGANPGYEVRYDTLRERYHADYNLENGKWDLVSVVKSGNNLSLFVNGNLSKQDNYPFEIAPDGNADLFINSGDGRENFFNGWIDEVNISNTARSNSYIKLQYENQKSGQNLILFGEPPPEPPVILSQPTSATIFTGGTHSFEVDVQSKEAPQFQWFKNEAILEGKSERVLTIDSATPESAGSYYVIVTNPEGQATSQTATLTVSIAKPKIISHPQNISLKPGETANFSCRATGYGELEFAWFLNGELIPGATTSSLSVNSITEAMDGWKYQCQASNQGGDSLSDEATLTVTVDPCELSFQANAPDTAFEGQNLILEGSVNCTEVYIWQKISGSDWAQPQQGEKVDTISIPRLEESEDLVYRFSARFGNEWKYKDFTVSIINSIPNPQFELTTDSIWIPGSELTVVYQITNMPALSQSGADDVTGRWFASGIEVDTLSNGTSLLLNNPGEKGLLSVGLCLENGGEEVCHVREIIVKDPITAISPLKNSAGLPVQLQNHQLLWTAPATIRILNTQGRTLLRISGGSGHQVDLSHLLGRGLQSRSLQLLIE